MKHGNYTNFNGTELPLKFKEFKYWSFLQGSNAKIDDNFLQTFFLLFTFYHVFPRFPETHLRPV
jgi:hypothetical protein